MTTPSTRMTINRFYTLIFTLFIFFFLHPSTFTPSTSLPSLLFVDGGSSDANVVSELDYYRYYSPVRVQILSLGLTRANFTNGTRDYLKEYQVGLYSFFRDSPMSMGADVGLDNFPIESFQRISTETETRWMFTLAYNASHRKFFPYDAYGNFAQYCQRYDDSGRCDPTFEGGILRYFVGTDETSDQYKERQWLLYFDGVLLECCDSTFAIDRQTCPDCSSRNYLPLILGCVLGFLGLVACIVGLRIACRVQKRRRAARGIKDAGHKPPPKNIGPAFDTTQHKSSPTPNHPPMMMMRADHMGHHAPTSSSHTHPPPVVITIPKDGSSKKTKKEEPDAVSTPEGHPNHKSDKHRPIGRPLHH